ncbi:unnamed protein product [Thlaspi arvense]|uniref:Uncharacterized protein n=1 Tax=Thlaspi arvense TaxID=13288 RepID=A0AAU9RNQ8_THLAR|nr:unnamed protein product [Thlaspi arvense]
MEEFELPPRLIKAGEVSLADRVNKIFDTLGEDEIAFFRRSPLGKLLDMPSKPVWSGGFGLYLLSKQHNVDTTTRSGFSLLEKDHKVQNMVNLIEKGILFEDTVFVGRSKPANLVAEKKSK